MAMERDGARGSKRTAIARGDDPAQQLEDEDPQLEAMLERVAENVATKAVDSTQIWPVRQHREGLFKSNTSLQIRGRVLKASVERPVWRVPTKRAAGQVYGALSKLGLDVKADNKVPIMTFSSRFQVAGLRHCLSGLRLTVSGCMTRA